MGQWGFLWLVCSLWNGWKPFPLGPDNCGLPSLRCDWCRPVMSGCCYRAQPPQEGGLIEPDAARCHGTLSWPPLHFFIQRFCGQQTNYPNINRTMPRSSAIYFCYGSLDRKMRTASFIKATLLLKSLLYSMKNHILKEGTLHVLGTSPFFGQPSKNR